MDTCKVIQIMIDRAVEKATQEAEKATREVDERAEKTE